MDIVYICRDGDNEELRYSLRSLEANYKLLNNVWLVGGKPYWYNGNHIEVLQDRAYYTNARNNLKTVTLSESISDQFILMNDDFFIMQPVEKFEYFYSGTLRDKISLRSATDNMSMYLGFLNKTFSELYKMKIHEPLDYELHVPMQLDKMGLRNVINMQGLWRSLYGNINNVGGIQMKDVKLYELGHPKRNEHIDMETTVFLSTEDSIFNRYKEWFQERFPEPSSIEHP